MFSYFKPDFIEKFLWESCCFKFWSPDYFCETKIRFLAAILKRNIFECSFCWFMVVLGVYRYAQVSYRNSCGKVLKNEWFQVDPPQMGVKSSLGT